MKPQDPDDHAPVEPDDELLANVRARSRSFRRRRSTQRMTSVTAALVVIALAGGIAWTRVDSGGNRRITLPAATSTTATSAQALSITPAEITGTWLAYTIAGYGYIKKGPPGRPALNSDPQLSFDGQGRWTGSDGCNSLSGGYRLDENGVRFDPEVRSTLVGCGSAVPDFGQIEKAPRSEIRDGQLTFLSADGIEIARFLRPDITARIELPSTTMTAGSTMSGHVVVENNTGHEIHATGCGSLFAVMLGNAAIHPDPAWSACAQDIVIPVGETSYPVSILATYNACNATGDNGIPRCLSGQRMPPLPAGDYQARFFQSSPVVTPALPIDVKVEP